MLLDALQAPPSTEKDTVELDYSPQARQSEFHLSRAKYRLYIGAWRSGKSFASCWEALKQSLLYPKNMGLIGRKDFSDLRESTIKTFFEVAPPRLIKKYNKTEHVVTLVNDSEIMFRELKDRSGLGSIELGWFAIDEAEEVTEEIFTYLTGRLSSPHAKRRCGWLTSNPPNEDHWIFKTFEVDKKNDKDYFTIHASTYENRENLPEGYIESLEKLPASWRKKYLEGQYGFTPDGTPFYQGYSDVIHKHDLPVDSDVVLDCGWDFGFHHPAFVVTQKQGNRLVVLDEILGSDTTLEKFIDNQVFPLLHHKYNRMACRHFGDPSCLQVNDKSEFTSWQILKSHGVRIMCKPSEYRLRKEIIERLLATMDKGLPQLVVTPRCKIINDGFLGGYHYPTFTAGKPFGFKFEQPFRDGFFEHTMNALEYVIIHLFAPANIYEGRPNAKKPYQRKRPSKLTGNGDNI